MMTEQEWQHFHRWHARDYETLARIHSCGPTGHKKKATVACWKKVQRHLDK